MFLVIVAASLASLLVASGLYGVWVLYRSRDAAREWRERCEGAEQQVAALERHLRGLAKVIHHSGGGVVQRYYEIAALRFVLMRQHPAAWDAASSIPQWLRAHSEFLHDLAEQAKRVGTTEDMRRRIEAVRVGHGDELSAYAMAVDAVSPTASSPDGDDTPRGGSAIEEAERQAVIYLLQVAAALAFSGRFVSAESGGRGSAMAGVERMCEEAERIVRARADALPERVAAVIAAADAMRETLGTAWLAGPAAAKPTPSRRQLDELKASVMDGVGAALSGVTTA
jgi:hypothetical protein